MYVSFPVLLVNVSCCMGVEPPNAIEFGYEAPLVAVHCCWLVGVKM